MRIIRFIFDSIIDLLGVFFFFFFARNASFELRSYTAHLQCITCLSVQVSRILIGRRFKAFFFLFSFGKLCRYAVCEVNLVVGALDNINIQKEVRDTCYSLSSANLFLDNFWFYICFHGDRLYCTCPYHFLLFKPYEYAEWSVHFKAQVQFLLWL